MAPSLTKGEYETLAHFRYQLRRFLRFSEDATRTKGITVLQYLLLLQIKGFPRREWASVGELAERLQAKPHGVVSLISRCEALGLVNRHRGGRDRRRVEVRLTQKGNRYVGQLALLHRSELLSLQGIFAVPDQDALRSKAKQTNASFGTFSAATPGRARDRGGQTVRPHGTDRVQRVQSPSIPS